MWLLFSSFVLLQCSIVLLRNRGQLMMRPGGEYWRIPQWRRAAFVAASWAFTNIPDAASVVVYLVRGRMSNQMSVRADQLFFR